jgi:hypothetical protein
MRESWARPLRRLGPKGGAGTAFRSSPRGGEGSRTRTYNQRIKSPMLYQLSYAPGILFNFQERARGDSNARPADSKSDALSI